MYVYVCVRVYVTENGLLALERVLVPALLMPVLVLVFRTSSGTGTSTRSNTHK